MQLMNGSNYARETRIKVPSKDKEKAEEKGIQRWGKRKADVLPKITTSAQTTAIPAIAPLLNSKLP